MIFLNFLFLTFNHRKRSDIFFLKKESLFSNSKFCFSFFFEPKNWESKVVKIDCCNLPNLFECLFYFISGLGCISTRNFAILLYKTRVGGAIVFFYVFLFFRAYISWWNERELYNGKWKKQRSYQREETRRKGCEIHIKKYIDEYSTMWPKFFDVKSHFFFISIFLPATI